MSCIQIFCLVCLLPSLIVYISSWISFLPICIFFKSCLFGIYFPFFYFTSSSYLLYYSCISLMHSTHTQTANTAAILCLFASNGNIFRVTSHLCGEFIGPWSKQSRGWWFETLPRPLWRHINGCGLLPDIHIRFPKVFLFGWMLFLC